MEINDDFVDATQQVVLSLLGQLWENYESIRPGSGQSYKDAAKLAMTLPLTLSDVSALGTHLERVGCSR